jgi:hypothetical protein
MALFSGLKIGYVWGSADNHRTTTHYSLSTSDICTGFSLQRVCHVSWVRTGKALENAEEPGGHAGSY